PLVDDSIVVLENTHRHLEMGKNPSRAAFDGTLEVTLPVLVATSTTIIVLCPLALMPGIGGFLFKPLTLAVAFAMLASFVLARSFVPGLCGKLLRPHDPVHHDRPRGIVSRLYGCFVAGLLACNRFYERVLLVALRHRGKVLTVAGLLFAGSLFLLK